MSIERSSLPLPPDVPPAQTIAPGDATDAMRLQILSTEHWSLLATRSMAWNEVFARAGMQLSALSGAVVALALVGQGSSFGSQFLLFGIAILPVVLLLGIGTFIRLSQSNRLDARCVVGMNRIRAGYLHLAPDLAPYFVTGTSDDMAGIARTLGVPFESRSLSIASLMSATPTLVAVVNGVVVGALVAFILLTLGIPIEPVLGAAAVAFAVAFAAHGAFARSQVSSFKAGIEAAFPGREREA